MNNKSIDLSRLADKFLWIGIAAGIFFWVFESFIHVFIFREGKLTGQLFYPDAHEIWMRLFVAGILVLFGTFFQFIIKQRRRAEIELRQEKDSVQKYLDVAGVMFVAINNQGEVVLVNKKGCQILGYEEGEIIGKNWFENFLPERLREDIIAVSKKILAGHIENSEYYENPVLTKQGEERVIAWHNSVLRDAQGNIIGHLSSGEDITERRLGEMEIRVKNRALVAANEELIRVQEELRGSEAMLRSIFRAAPTGIGIVRDRILGWTNSMIHEMTGYSEEELMGKSARIVYPSDEDYDYVGKQKYSQILERGTGTVETQWKRKDGTVIDVLLSSTPINLDDLNAGVTFTALDITDRKRMEKALRESEKRYRSFVQNFQGIAFRGNINFVPLFFHGSVEKITGYKEQEFLAGKPRWDQIIHPDDKPKISESMEKIRLIPNYSAEREYRIICKDGKVVWVYELIQNICDDSGTPVYVQGAIYDITDRVQAEETLRESESQLRSLTTRLSEVEEDERRRLAQELHDKVGQGLAALSINLNVVKSLLPTEVAEKLRGHLDDSVRLLEETTKEIRDVMAELRPPVLDDYGLTAALRWYGEQFSKLTGIPIDVQGEDLTPRPPADVEITLFRIAQEALTNAAKHAQASHVNLSVKGEPERLLLTIADDGTGFNPVAVGLPAGEAKWGLITMQERANALGGQFQVESGPEKGTRIIVDVRR
jgi:PAS domain S-box-containing protein